MKGDRPKIGKAIISLRIENAMITDLENIAAEQNRNFSNLSQTVLMEYRNIATHPDENLLKLYNELVAAARKK